MMQVLEGLSALGDVRPAAVTIGTFDGLHSGHRALIEATIAHARACGVQAAAVTWDRHPFATLRPEHTPPLLTSTDRKLELFAETGLDLVAVLAFDRELSTWPPERFVRDILVRGLSARAVVVGSGWRFGRGAAGDVALLTSMGTGAGFSTVEIDLASRQGDAVSSSRIRALVADGDMQGAAALLGRPFDVDGTVVRGDDRGRALGFPTANLRIDPSIARPARGVYAGRARINGRWHSAAANVGVNPTFGGDPETTPLRVEAYLLDLDENLYGRVLRLEFWKRLRDEVRFDSVDELVEQMGRDVADTRAVVERA